MIGISFTFKDYVISDDRTESHFTYQVVTDSTVFDFKEKLRWPEPLRNSVSIESLHKSLHLALGMSYYKTFIPPVIEHRYGLTAPETQFWNSVYINGLGEFLYKNDLDPSVLAQFAPQDGIKSEADRTLELQPKALLGIGGGKDSIVAGEILKDSKIDVQGFVVATKTNTGMANTVTEAMGIDLSVVERTIDPGILTANQESGAYNGHIPVSMIFALIGSVLAINSNSAYVMVANESSASIPQMQWHNRKVNHQWSKSLEFEILFQNYIHESVALGLHYFSAIRPLSSVGVARLFAQYPQYFEKFTSDNSLLKIIQEERQHPRWSPKSTKSLSSFILLAPWINDEDLIRIFGKNYLEDESLKQMLSDLLGHGEKAVLDCVGTPEELVASLSQMVSYGRYSDKALMKFAVDEGYLKNATELRKLTELSNNAFPSEISNKLLHTIEKKL